MSYADTHEHLVDELERIDRLVRAAVQAPADDGGVMVAGRGEELLRLLGGEDDRDPAAALDAHADRIDRRLAESGDVSRLARLTERFDLSRADRDALLLALAPDVERRYEQVYARLQQDGSLRRPTVDLLTKLLGGGRADRVGELSTFTSSSPLVAADLLDLSTTATGRPFTSRVVSVDRRVRSYLFGDDELDPELVEVAAVRSPSVGLDELSLTDGTREDLAAVPTGPGTAPTAYYFYGPDGAGKRRAVEAVCRANGQEFVEADAATALETGTLDRIAREATLRNGAVHLADVDELDEEGPGVDGDGTAADAGGAGAGAGGGSGTAGGASVGDLLAALRGFDGHVFLTGEQRWTPDHGTTDHDFALVEFPRPPYELRQELWEGRADELPESVDPTRVATKFELTQAGVEDALATGRALSADGDLDRESLYEGCKAQSGGELSSLADKIEPGYDWDDIVLPPDTERRLREVAAHINYRGTVYADWGFASRFSRGTGVVALMAGPSGTGKTMAAEVLANDAGLDLYRIELSSVVSKYIGETEENLERIFDDAEHSNAILLFDEADAIFGERTEVSDSTDRYANVEVNYLLQRIEGFDGVVLMTTNYEQNIDDAFKRRIHLNIEFRKPDREARRAIWEGIFPEEMPLEDVDYEFLANLELTGGNIRNVAQSAAFLAADAGEPVGMKHLVRAATREISKTGQLVDPSSLGPYRDLLEG